MSECDNFRADGHAAAQRCAKELSVRQAHGGGADDVVVPVDEPVDGCEWQLVFEYEWQLVLELNTSLSRWSFVVPSR